jgi:hypothetical protein
MEGIHSRSPSGVEQQGILRKYLAYLIVSSLFLTDSMVCPCLSMAFIAFKKGGGSIV